MPIPEIDVHGHHWVNVVGHLAGVLVFATLFLLIFRESRHRRLRVLPLASTLLALGWDLGLLLGLGLRESHPDWANVAAALGFACLSLLPAVLLDLGLVGYLLGAVCAALHLSEPILQNPAVHGFALVALAGGSALLAALGYLIPRRRADALSAACVFALSLSFLHLHDQSHTQALWSELALHHAAIPIALFVVLRDYRFLLFDAFLRLAVTGALAASFVAAVWQMRGWLANAASDEFGFGLLLAGAGLTLIAYAKVREWAQRWLTRQVFLRRDPDIATQQLAALEGNEAAMLEQACRILAEYFRADRWGLADSREACANADAVCALHFLKGDHLYLYLSGRRFLSEDMAALERFCERIAREVDRARSREMESLMMQAELRALQAQIHPHFLFNALNALYGSIPRHVADARRLVLSLSEVFRYFLTTSKTTVKLEEELTIIEAYIEIEKARLGSRLTASIDVPEELRQWPIPVLCVEPLVENAIKHGVASKPGPGEMHLSARIVDGQLWIEVRDSGIGPQPEPSQSSNLVGLENVRRRLFLHYGAAASLEMFVEDGSTVARLVLPAERQNQPAQPAQEASDRILLGERTR